MSYLKTIIAPNSIPAGTLLQTPLEKLTALPKRHSRNLTVLLLRRGKRKKKEKGRKEKGKKGKGKKKGKEKVLGKRERC